jgi:hypothetical protein
MTNISSSMGKQQGGHQDLIIRVSLQLLAKLLPEYLNRNPEYYFLSEKWGTLCAEGP